MVRLDRAVGDLALDAGMFLSITRGACEALNRLHLSGRYHNDVRLGSIDVQPGRAGGSPSVSLVDTGMGMSLEEMIAAGRGEREGGAVWPPRQPGREMPAEALIAELGIEDPLPAAIEVYKDLEGCPERTRRVALPFALYDCACLGMALTRLMVEHRPGGDQRALRSARLTINGLMHPYNIDVLTSCIEEERAPGEDFVDLVIGISCYDMFMTNTGERINTSYALVSLIDN